MKITKESLNVGFTPMGTSLEILKYELDSECAGKTVYIQSGIHGGEITQWILHELYHFLEDKMISGKVVLIPCANPVSWTQRAYYSTNGKFDFYMGKDWNRNFPGNFDGSMGERIAATLFAMAKQADFALDLHTSRHSIPFGIFSKQEYLPWVKVAGVRYNQFIDMGANSAYKNTLNSCLDNAGVPNLCIECGSHDAYEAENVQEVVAAVKRLLVELKVVKAENENVEPKKVKVFSKTVKYCAQKGSLIRLAKKLGDEVCLGDDLFYFFENNARGKTTVEKARHNGVLFKTSPTYIYWSGDDVLQLLLQDDVREI